MTTYVIPRNYHFIFPYQFIDSESEIGSDASFLSNDVRSEALFSLFDDLGISIRTSFSKNHCTQHCDVVFFALLLFPFFKETVKGEGLE